MRKKIAKRLRRQCLRGGMEIIKEEFSREPGWKRKDCGVCVKAKYHGWTIMAIGFDWLEAYRMLVDELDDPLYEETWTPTFDCSTFSITSFSRKEEVRSCF